MHKEIFFLKKISNAYFKEFGNWTYLDSEEYCTHSLNISKLFFQHDKSAFHNSTSIYLFIECEKLSNLRLCVCVYTYI